MEFMEDYDLALRLALENNSWAYIREPLVVWREGSPLSLHEKAKQRELKISEYALTTRENALLRVADNGHNLFLEKLLDSEVKHNRREVASAKLAERTAIGKMANKVLKRVERYRRALQRRSPFHPKPKFERVKQD
jgi:hypothetical protein